MWILGVLLLAGPVQQQEPAETVTLIGRVVSSEDGSAVPFGHVVVSRGSGSFYSLRIKDGRFSGAVARGEGYNLSIQAHGFANLNLNNVSVYRGMAPFTLELRRVWPLIGQVVDPQGRGVPDARVAVSLDAEGANTRMAARADERGYFNMEAALDRGVHYLIAVKAGYEPASPIPFEYPSRDELRIELTPLPGDETGSIAGIATLGGKPLAGREVGLTRSGGEEVSRAKTNARGEFHFLDVAPGEYQLNLLGDNPQFPAQPRRHIVVAAGQPTRAELALFEGRLSGVVFSFEGEPVREVLVSLSAGLEESQPLADTAEERDALQRRNSRKYVFHHVQTDERGRFVFKGIETGSYLLRVHSGPPFDHPEQTMSVEVSADDELRIVLEPGLVMRGLLLDADGSVINAFGYEMGALDDPTSSSSVPVNSPQGLFLIRGLKPALYWFRVSLRDGRNARSVIDLNRGANILFQMPAVEGAELEVRYERR